MKKFLWAGLIGGLIVILGVYGYERYIVSMTGNEATIKKDNAKSLAVKARFGAGSLTIRGGADEWMEADFDYKHKKNAPKVTSTVKKGTNFITVEQKPQILSFNRSKLESTWDMRLNNDIPIDLDVDMGVSDATMDLKGLQLNKLKIDSGVSDSTIDLSGEWKNSFSANINLGVGDMTILLPKKTGVKVTVSTGIGRADMKDFIAQGKGVYVNEAYENADVKIEIKADVGIGNLTIKLVE